MNADNLAHAAHLAMNAHYTASPRDKASCLVAMRVAYRAFDESIRDPSQAVEHRKAVELMIVERREQAEAAQE